MGWGSWGGTEEDTWVGSEGNAVSYFIPHLEHSRRPSLLMEISHIRFLSLSALSLNGNLIPSIECLPCIHMPHMKVLILSKCICMCQTTASLQWGWWGRQHGSPANTRHRYHVCHLRWELLQGREEPFLGRLLWDERTQCVPDIRRGPQPLCWRLLPMQDVNLFVVMVGY